VDAPLPFSIEPACIDDLDALPGIEREAAALFTGWQVPLSVLQEQTSLRHFAAAQRDGRLWVARSPGGEVVGFALVDLVGGEPHLEEMDVLPSHGRQGIGRALVGAVQAWARASGYDLLTLTTFRDVPWNAHFYRRVGFQEVSPQDLSPELQSLVREEAARGLDPARRVVMSCSLGTFSGGGAR
jgi:GNAT superfamily N-acetyltransferase